MKRNKICIMFIVLLITCFALTNTVNASSTFNLKLNSTKTTYSKGETVKINIDLSNVTESSGIAGYQGKIEYDSNVLTKQSVTSDNWEIMENEGAIVANTKDTLGVKTGTTATITFKVNENTTEESTTINVKNITGSNGDLVSVEGTSSSINISINSGNNNSGDTTNNNQTSGGTTNNNQTSGGTTNNNQTSGGTTNNNQTSGGTTNNNKPSGGTTNNNQTSGGTTNYNKNNTTTNNKIPYAGSESLVGILAAVATIGIVCYIRYKKTL